MREEREVCSRAGADSLAIVSVAAKLAATLVSLALVDGQADACRAVPAQLQQHATTLRFAANIAEDTSLLSGKLHANRRRSK